jgi:phosphatidylglycerol:prolipoprotein diacylglycerol transferase
VLASVGLFYADFRMLTFPGFDPVAFTLFHRFPVRWYGLMYLLAFTLVLVLGRYRIKKRGGPITAADLDDLLFFGMLGTILGGRLGYILFYQPALYLPHPLMWFQVWNGGMSFHGGLLGVICAMALYAYRRGLSFWTIADFVAPLVPLGLAAGRTGNFINGELWGRPSDVPWAMVFPGSHDGLPRHPSQLYEVALEGLVLFALVWWFSSKPRPRGAVAGLFLIGYGCARFTVEFTREPDSFLGLLSFGLSMGQWLSLPMILAGVALMVWSYRRAQIDDYAALSSASEARRSVKRSP